MTKKQTPVLTIDGLPWEVSVLDHDIMLEHGTLGRTYKGGYDDLLAEASDYFKADPDYKKSWGTPDYTGYCAESLLDFALDHLNNFSPIQDYN